MVKITDKAREKMIGALDDEKREILRFGLKGGGCSGFQYYFAIEDIKEEDDNVYPLDNTHILIVDPMSSMYLDDAEIDFKSDLMGENFVFNNPNAKGSCGCGSSTSF